MAVDVVGIANQSNGDNQGGLFLTMAGVVLGRGVPFVARLLETEDPVGPLATLDETGDFVNCTAIGDGGGTTAAETALCGAP